ncbi:protein TPX2 isoform X2 [Dendrobium catenatum]|uniref:protein TPX2 isoform X2 n=1 Tax=Dendrobium catenatum TaxID=906689 RepID=UPI00109F760B|nr:protein TPX2 isoform X2 [Dendrobium catenatum]
MLLKYIKYNAVSRSSNGRKSGKGGQLQPVKLHTEQRAGPAKEPGFVRKVQEYVAEDPPKHLPLNNNLSKLSVKEQTKTHNFKLHTEERAARRAGFNHLVASKISTMEILRRFEEKIQKVIEEEEIKIMRKDMVPKAQLMPIFDRPFLPQRSTRPLTVPKEPNFRFLGKNYGSAQDSYTVYQYFSQNVKAIR